MTAPILFLIFNRPELTRKVFAEIKKQRPGKFFIAADGPRKNRSGEKELCNQTREIINEIDWECDVKTLFRSENLGCGKAVSEAINWFFENVEEGIILEDDCLPHPSFFTFSNELLEYYRNDKHIMHINGSNYQLGIKRGEGSYYFSRYAHIWGWATWKRAWDKYDFSLKTYKSCSKDGLNPYLLRAINAVNNNKIDTWDTQWFFSVWCNKGWTITPNINLVTNIGMGEKATHTKRPPSWFKKMRYGEILQIQHPSQKQIDHLADKFCSENIFITNYFKAAIKKIYKIITRKI